MMKKLLCTLIFTIVAFGFAQGQSIDVTGLGVVIPGDGSNIPVVTDDTDFGPVDVTSGSVTHTFTVNNITASDLILTGLNNIGGTNPTDFTKTDILNPILFAGQSSTFTVTFDPNAPAGLKSAIISIGIFNLNQNSTETYIFNVQGTATEVTAPDIDVIGNGISIVSPDLTPSTLDDTDFGQVDVTSGSVTHTFTIANTGNAPLNLTGTPLVLISGGSGDFTVTNLPTTPIPALSSTTFDITFDPSSPGPITANVLIQNDDPDSAESNFLFTVGGEGIVSQPDIDVIGNGVSIISPDFTPSTVDDTDFGQVDVTSGSVTHTFTIANTGNAPLNLTGASLVLITGGSGDFTVTNLPTTPIPALSSTTFDITFDPSSTGIITANVLIQSNDPDSETNFLFTIQGEGVSEPEIDVLGNAISIIGDGTNTPNLLDGTDFGPVPSGTNSAEQLFTIQNTGSGSLIVNPSSSSDPNFVISTAAVSPVAPGGSTTIGITFNAPVALGIYNTVLSISNNDSDEDPYEINIRAESISPDPEMDVFGLGIEIADGDTTPDLTDDTDYGQADVTTGSVSHTFTIENNGGSDLNLTDPDPFVILSGDVGDFSVNARPPFPIAAGGSSDFVIEFNPTAVGIRTVTVSIGNNDSDENPYTFVIQGEGIDANADSPLLITQYYEGAGNDKWIEVKNISINTVIAGQYVLALYTDANTLQGTINITAPQQSEPIVGTGPFGQILPGEVIIFRNSAAASPSSPNLGNALIINSNVCTFTGNDVILISTNNGTTCYDNRTDIMGVVELSTGFPPTWGQDKSFIKGCGTNEQPSLVFATQVIQGSLFVTDYIELTTDEVNGANAATNIALGTQGIGSTTWTTSWDNETADRTRDVVINGTYTASDGSLESCNLTVAGNLNFNNGTSNFVAVNEDLIVGGTFIVGDQESLYTVNALFPFVTGSIIGSVTKIESSTSLVDIKDYTYWSSPVQGANIGSVFSNANLERVYYWDQAAENIIPGGDVGDPTITLGEWILASGTMTPVKGYISQGPTSGAYPQSHTISFSGTPNNGTIPLGLVHNDDGNPNSDFNLIGNPYPSAIDADEFINSTDNNSIDGTIWLWTHNTQNNGNPLYQYTVSDYVSYNLTGGIGGVNQNIGSGQGFMVRAISGGSVVFNNTMRLRDQNTQFFRGTETKNALAEEKDRIWLNVESSEGGASSELLIGFFDQATDDHDRGYDGLYLASNWISFYSKIDTLGYSIQGLSSFSLDKKVTLGFDTYIIDPLTYKISILNIEGVLKDNDVYLVDHELNVTHDLKQADYEFNVDGEGYFPDRFTLQFTKSTLSIDELTLDNNFVVINEDNSLRLRSNTVISNIKVYDITGRLLLDKEPNNNEFTVSTQKIGPGTVLILNATFENGAEASKKAIKY